MHKLAYRNHIYHHHTSPFMGASYLTDTRGYLYIVSYGFVVFLIYGLLLLCNNNSLHILCTLFGAQTHTIPSYIHCHLNWTAMDVWFLCPIFSPEFNGRFPYFFFLYFFFSLLESFCVQSHFAGIKGTKTWLFEDCHPFSYANLAWKYEISIEKKHDNVGHLYWHSFIKFNKPCECNLFVHIWMP